jgi:hypothetical protein
MRSSPHPLKAAKIIPVFNSNKRLLVNNYQVSTNFCIADIKVLVLMHKKFLIHIQVQDFSDNQHGCKENHSTYMASLITIDMISENKETMEYFIGLLLDFLDLSKAFYSDDHISLLKK